MGVLERFSTYIKSLMSAFMDRAEDPSVTLDYAYEQQLEQLQNLRRSIADVATNEKRLELQQAQVQLQVQHLDDQAHQALAANREDLARLALERKRALQEEMVTYAQQIEQIKAQEQKFVALEQRLSTRVEAFRSRKEMTKAEYGAARAQVSIQEAATGISEEMTDVNLAVQRAQEKVQEMQARAGAMDELITSGTLPELGAGTADDVDRELAAIASRSQVDQDLAALKAQAQLPRADMPPKQLLPASEPSTPSQ